MTQVWARALAAEVDDEVFWHSTLPEVRALMSAKHDMETQRQKMANTRAGVIAAEVHNSAPFGKKTRRARKPSDYFAYPGEGSIDTPRNLRTALVMWGERTHGVTVQ